MSMICKTDGPIVVTDAEHVMASLEQWTPTGFTLVVRNAPRVMTGNLTDDKQCNNR